MCILFFAFALFITEKSYSQTIGTPTVTGTPVCGGSSVQVTFTVTNANGNGNTANKRFTTSTAYNVFDTTGGLEFPTGSFNSSTAPADTAGASAVITLTVPIPNDPGLYPTSSDYQIRVSTSVPGADSPLSTQFFVNNDTTPTPTASNNGPLCIGGNLNLTASTVSGATYNWTGPNGYTSTVQNPTINNVNTSNNGDYSVTAIVNGCSSSVATTTVVINNSNSWTGAVSTDWNNQGNWSCNSIPSLTSNATIPTGISNYPILNLGAVGTVSNLIIEPNATLKILDNILEIAGAVNNSGVFNVLSGEIEFRGTSSQTIPSNVFLNNTIRNLTINNTSGVINNSSLMITGVLKATTGNLNTGGTLTLISTAAQTALIDGSGNGGVVGDVTMQRHLDPAMGYKYFSSPFQNTTATDFSSVVDLTATFPNFYRYNENRENTQSQDATGFENYSSSLNILEGYALNFGSASSPKTVEITGTVTNGSQQINLSHNNGTFTKGFNLVGNPYPSPIDWNAASGWTKNNIDDAVYFFSASDQYTGVYTSFVNGVQSGGGSSANIIPSMQGFFVHVTDSPTNTYPVSATLGTTNAVRVTDFSQKFYKSPFEDYFTLVRLDAIYDGGIRNDETVIYFENTATEAYDKNYDALKLMNTDPTVPNLYSLSSDKKPLSINAVSAISGSDVLRIPLGINLDKEGWITLILADKEENIFTGYVYLVDLEKRKRINLLDMDHYRFQASAGKNDSRFQLVFSNSVIDDPAIIFKDLFSVDQSGASVKIKMNLAIGEVGDIRVSTVAGQNIESQFVSANDEIEITGIKSSGLYLVTFYSNEGVFTKKVLIQK